MATVSRLYNDCCGVVFSKGGRVCLGHSASGSSGDELQNGIKSYLQQLHGMASRYEIKVRHVR
jgi:hypothetical protein